MKAKTQDLTGAALDWAVAKCEDKNGVLHDDGITRCIVIAAPSGVYKGRYTPTVNWAQGGPIIDSMVREGLRLTGYRSLPTDPTSCQAQIGNIVTGGQTPLIAAMRCYCSFKLGNEVDVPKELI